jgi:hypothetical protein
MAGTKSAQTKSGKKTSTTSSNKATTKPKVVNAKTVPVVDNVEEKETKFVMPSEIDLSERVAVRNIADWKVSFTRFIDAPGGNDATGIIIPAHGVYQLTRNEIVAQVNDGRKFFAGTDGQGSHATLYIEDKATRVYLGFENVDTEQNIFTEEALAKIFKIRNQPEFEEAYKNLCQTRAEKMASIKTIKEDMSKDGDKFNDFRKIYFIEKLTGYKVF